MLSLSRSLIFLLGVMILNNFYGFTQVPGKGIESAFQRLSQEELISGCRSMVGLVDQAIIKEDFAGMVVYLHAYHDLREGVKDPVKVAPLDKYMNEVNKRYGPYVFTIRNSGPTSNTNVTDGNFTTSNVSIPFILKKNAGGWTHNEINKLMTDIMEQNTPQDYIKLKQEYEMLKKLEPKDYPNQIIPQYPNQIIPQYPNQIMPQKDLKTKVIKDLKQVEVDGVPNIIAPKNDQKLKEDNI